MNPKSLSAPGVFLAAVVLAPTIMRQNARATMAPMANPTPIVWIPDGRS
jgi:hypothetical protein